MKSSAKCRLLVSLLIPLMLFSLVVGMSPLWQEASAAEPLQLNGAGDFSESHEIDDSSGDGDGCPEPGESILMPVTLTNTADDTFTDVTATLSTLTYNLTTVFSDDMEAGEGAWIYDGLWHLSEHRSNTPTHAWYYGREVYWNYNIGDNWGSLTSPVIDLTGVVEEATLSFWYLYQTETSGTSWDRRYVEMSVNGGPFQTLEQLSGDSMLTWHEKIIDLSGYVGNTIQIRFRFDTIDSIGNSYEGWYIDDVVLTGLTLMPIPDSYITITDGYKEYGDIPPGDAAVSPDGYRFNIDPDCPVDHEVFFHLDISSSSGGPWSLDFQIAIGGGITVTPTSGLVTTEAGGTDTFTVVLNSEPTADVTIGLSSSNTAEGTVSTSSLIFDSTNWDIPQTVTVTGVDDGDVDGDIAYDIITAPATSADPNYSNLDAPDVSVINSNNDGITVTPTSGLVTTEAGGTDTFTVVLDIEPAADVTIGLSSSNTAEGTVSPLSLTFNSTNWDTPQMVTVTGVDDDDADGDIAYEIITAPATSTDTNYNQLDAPDVSVTNSNDDAGIGVTPTSGLVTTEAGGTDTFTVVLKSKPAADVTIGLSSSNTAEGTVSPSSLTFNTTDWDIPQTVTVTGVDDDIDDDDITYEIITAPATSDDPDYSNLDVSNVSVTNNDNDAAGITVTPTSGLVTTEAGGTDTFTVVLNSEPAADVTIGLSSSNTAEGTVSPSSVIFDSTDWDIPQTVTVTGVDDDIDDGNIALEIITTPATSDDPDYSNLDVSNVSVTNNDNDAAGITITPTSGLVTTEAGGTDTFTVVLNSQPTANVTIGLSSSDTAEGTVSPSSVTFDSTNWDIPQTVTVTGVDDDIGDGDIAYAIITAPATSADPNYSNLNASNVSVTNNNDDPGVTVDPTSGLVTTEAGGTDTFTVVLNIEPTASVTIGLSSSNTTEGTVSPSSLTFNSTDWDTPQTVTVTGVDDDIDDGNIAYTIITAPATSDDPNYSNLDASDVSVTNNNDDPGITVNPASGLVTTEAGGTDTFTVVLNTEPAASVTIGLSSSDTAEGIVWPSSLTFNLTNWDIPQTVTVTGVDDDIDDDDITYLIITAPATSADPNYSNLDASDVSVTNNNDDPGIKITPISRLVTTEASGTDTFTVVLRSEPIADVTISFSSSDTAEGKVSPSSLTFDSTNWDIPQTVTVTGVDDDIDDGNITYLIITTPATSADPNYSNLDASEVFVTNNNDDVAGITVDPTSGLVTTEAGDTDTFTVVLNSEPTADVTIELSSSDTSEGNVSPSSLTFNSTNWDIPKTVTVTGVDDDDADDDIAYEIIIGPATSADPNYSNLDASEVNVTNNNDDNKAIAVWVWIVIALGAVLITVGSILIGRHLIRRRAS